MRLEWALATTECCYECGTTPTDIHEIEPRSMAPRSWAHTCNFSRYCRPHHTIIDRVPQAAQLAHKFIHDREHYDLETWLTLRAGGGGPDRITQEDVDREVRRIQNV